MSDLVWGLQITMLGMGLVFGLLALLWALLTLAQRLDVQPAVQADAVPLEPVAVGEAAGQASSAPPQPAAVQGMDAELVAAILVATLAHRALRRREAAPAMRSYQPGSVVHASRWVAAGRANQNRSWQRRGR